ncbi:MAG: hypothetical protein IJ144_05315 [Prevotella sp.]|nr:hypothetical protein [Prevotella sp.]
MVGNRLAASLVEELTADEEALIVETIDKHWDELNRMIDDVFAGKKITIKRIK